MQKKFLRDLFVLLVICFIAFWWHLGKVGLIDPDEPFYAETAHEMVVSGNWLTPQIFHHPQFEKPVFYYWFVAASYKLFGENEFSGRLTTAVFSTLIVLLTFVFVRRTFSPRIGFLSGLLLATGLEFCLMSRLMLTDVPLAFFFAAAIYCYWMAVSDPARRDRWVFLYVIATALAFFMKGPIGSFVPLLAAGAFSALSKRPHHYRGKGFWLAVPLFCLIAFPWYIIMLEKYGRAFWDEFFVRDNWDRFIAAEHPANNHWYYYIGLLTLGFIPWLPLVIITAWRGIRGAVESKMERRPQGRMFTFFLRSAADVTGERGLLLLLWCWILTSLILLTIAQSKLPSYILFLFIPLAIVMAHTLDSLIANGFRSVAERRTLLGLAIFQVIAAAVVPFVSKDASIFKIAAWLVAATLAVSVVFIWKNRVRAWAVASTLATIVLLGVALTVSLPSAEQISSSRPTAQKMLTMRQGGEPLFASGFLVRGIYYYTRQPVEVISRKSKPFWSPQAVQIIVWRGNGIQQYLANHHLQTALCVVRKSEWNGDLHKEPVFAARDAFTEIGSNIIVRAHAVPEPK